MTDQPRPDVPAKGPLPQQPSPPPASTESVQCGECGALLGDRDVCWLCGAPVVVSAELVHPPGVSPFVPDWEQKRRASASQFSLESLMLVITLISVCLGMIVAAPGIGLLVVIVAVPALVRTLVVGRYRKEAASPLNLGEKVMAFLASTGIIIGIMLAGLIAYWVACIGTCFAVLGVAQTATEQSSAEFWAVSVSIVTGAIVAIAVVGWLIWQSLPRRPKGTSE
jgi:hypothetical protein